MPSQVGAFAKSMPSPLGAGPPEARCHRRMRPTGIESGAVANPHATGFPVGLSLLFSSSVGVARTGSWRNELLYEAAASGSRSCGPGISERAGRLPRQSPSQYCRTVIFWFGSKRGGLAGTFQSNLVQHHSKHVVLQRPSQASHGWATVSSALYPAPAAPGNASKRTNLLG
jgi:hypothetical protein